MELIVIKRILDERFTGIMLGEVFLNCLFIQWQIKTECVFGHYAFKFRRKHDFESYPAIVISRQNQFPGVDIGTVRHSGVSVYLCGDCECIASAQWVYPVR